jgi:hypothetical protein
MSINNLADNTCIQVFQDQGEKANARRCFLGTFGQTVKIPKGAALLAPALAD